MLEQWIGKLNPIDSIPKIIVKTSQVAYKFYEKQVFKLFEIKKDYWAGGFDLYDKEYEKQWKWNGQKKPEPLTSCMCKSGLSD